MADNRQHGREVNALWNAAAIERVVDITYDLNRPKIDTTDHDSGDAREYIDGRKEFMISLSCRWNGDTGGDTVQIAMMTDWDEGTERSFEARMKSGAGLLKFTGNAKIEKISLTGPNDDVSMMNVDLYFNGTITKGTQ